MADDHAALSYRDASQPRQAPDSHPMNRWRSLISRYRGSLTDGALILAVMAVCTLLAWELDIFDQAPAATVQQKRIDLDEALTLCGILAVLLLIFSIRRYAEQRRETRRRVAAEHEARTLAYEDGLTGLPNRRRFDQALAAAIAAPPGADATHAVFMLDLNGFKQINDLHGHAVGDEVLAIVARRLLGAVRTGDLVSRFGGDEFAILALHLDGPAAATSIALRVIIALQKPIDTGSTHHTVGTGVGIALIPKDATTGVEALRMADVALYRAKSERVSSVRFFEEEMDRYVHDRAQMIDDLRTALSRDEIAPLFQPIVDLRTDGVVAFEAKPSWRHPTMGMVAAERFIPLAEECGLMVALTDQFLTLSCRAALQWPAGITLSIDLVPSQLADGKLADRVTTVLTATGLAAGRLEFEIAESVLVRSLTTTQHGLQRLRDIGVRVALDHFGTGYSSLYHLLNVKLDRVKIDRSLVAAMGVDGESANVVSALVGLGKGLGLIVTADGVRDGAQQASLLQNGCEQGQGLAFSTPLSADAAAALFADAQPVRLSAD